MADGTPENPDGSRPRISIDPATARVLLAGLRSVEIVTRQLAEDNQAFLADNPLATAENAGANPALGLLTELIAIVSPAVHADESVPETLDPADLVQVAADAPNMPDAA